MCQRIVFPTLLAVLAAAAGPARAQGSDGGLIPQTLARRYGLQRAWFAQVALDRARARVAHITQHVSATHALIVHEINHDRGKVVISQRSLDPLGAVLGVDGAQKLADETVAKLAADGSNPKLTTRAIPEIRLFVCTNKGMVHAIDAETGRTLWTTSVGRENHPTTEAGVNENYVAVINGSTFFVLDRQNGELKSQRRAIGVPGAGPALSSELAFLPMIGGALETLFLEDLRKTPSLYKFSGRAIIQPTVSPRSVAWTTDSGRMYVASATRAGTMRYRLETSAEITSSAAFFSPNKLVVASIDGDVYCIHEMSGDVSWRFSTGQPIRQSPVVINDAVYVNTEAGDLYRLSVDAGVEQLWLPQVKQFVAASDRRIYCVGDAGRLLILDAKSGGRIGELPTDAYDLKVANSLTDRIFIASSTGLIQCLREMQLEWPIVHAVPEQEQPQQQPSETAAESTAKPPAQQPAAEETAKEASPFGTPAKKEPKPPAAPPQGVNPFGGEKPPAGAEKPPAAAKKPPAAGKKPPAAGEKPPSSKGNNPFP